jgi:outer membrane protein assembly factor BamB
MVKLPVLLCLMILLSGCGSLNFWKEETSALDEIDHVEQEEAVEISTEPKELEDYEESVHVRKLWRSSAGKGQDPVLASLQPAILGEHIYSADLRGLVSAFTLVDGDRIWRTELDMPLTAGVGVGPDLLLVGSQDGEVVALEAETGEERWRVALTSEVLAPPTANNDVVIVQTQDGKVHGLSTASGELVWRYAAELPVLTLRGTGSPVLAGNMVVLGFANGKVVALNSGSGELFWETKLVAGEGKTELERMVDVNTPVLVGDLIYATSYQGKVGAVSRGAGRELWTHASSSYRAPSYGAGRLYVVDVDDKVYSYRASGGKKLWVNEDFLRRKLTEPLALAEHVGVADREGYLHILSRDDGQVVGRIKVDGDGVSVAMVSNQKTTRTNDESDSRETFFVLDNSGDLTAYRLEVE